MRVSDGSFLSLQGEYGFRVMFLYSSVDRACLEVQKRLSERFVNASNCLKTSGDLGRELFDHGRSGHDPVRLVDRIHGNLLIHPAAHYHLVGGREVVVSMTAEARLEVP